MSSRGGICPGNNERAGRHKDRHTTKGNPWYRATLIECAWSASRTRGARLRANTKPQIGHKRALVAVAHALGKAIYYVLARGQPFHHAKPELLNEVQRQRLIRHCTRRLRRLGCWLKPEKLSPLQEWYAGHCLRELDLPLRRPGRRKPQGTQSTHSSEGAVNDQP
jgi:hypothetical protein